MGIHHTKSESDKYFVYHKFLKLVFKTLFLLQNNLFKFWGRCCEFPKVFCCQNLMLNASIKAFWHTKILLV